jgi:hypothetical protein
VGSVAGAEPAVVLARARDGHAAEVCADAQHDQPAGERDRKDEDKRESDSAGMTHWNVSARALDEKDQQTYFNQGNTRQRGLV